MKIKTVVPMAEYTMLPMALQKCYVHRDGAYAFRSLRRARVDGHHARVRLARPHHPREEHPRQADVGRVPGGAAGGEVKGRK